MVQVDGRDLIWDDNKRFLNLVNHQLDLNDLQEFDWDVAKHWRSDRGDEIRFVAVGYFANKLHAVIYTDRQDTTRIISFRRANRKEERLYAAA